MGRDRLPPLQVGASPSGGDGPRAPAMRSTAIRAHHGAGGTWMDQLTNNQIIKQKDFFLEVLAQHRIFPLNPLDAPLPPR